MPRTRSCLFFLLCVQNVGEVVENPGITRCDRQFGGYFDEILRGSSFRRSTRLHDHVLLLAHFARETHVPRPMVLWDWKIVSPMVNKRPSVNLMSEPARG
ncbi:hypothetical protein B0H16DRAFT_1504860 [Mycena metata]|uniref:Secreted protein n=1 Tax=Mycena metata TaxID=1033252 RepID=A0AAD7NW13_9AGAR|nr:hypothetical protein B0H16DRAFT_1504860 [Mycena metata]